MSVEVGNTLHAAPATAVLIAGSDVMFKRENGLWWRAEDDSWHTSADIADFHGHSGFTLTVPDRTDADGA